MTAEWRAFSAMPRRVPLLRIAVEVAAVEDDVVREPVQVVFVVAELHEGVEERARAGRDLQADEAVVMRARRRGDHRP